MNTTSDEIKHEYDIHSMYCIHCGIAMYQEQELPNLQCTRATTVVAISHIRANRIMECLTNPLLE